MISGKIRGAAFLVSATLALGAGAASAKDEVKIGMLTTLSGASAETGRDIVDGFTLAVAHAGGKLGGLRTTIITGDDQAKPDVGLQAAEKMIERDKVDIITGGIYSNVFQALYKPVLDSGTFLINPQGHLAILAGKGCDANFVYLGTQSDNYAESTGIAMKKAGYKKVYSVSANYAAGKAVMNGFRRYYDLPLAGESWPNFGQTDFAAEIALIRAAKPDAIYVFLPGGMGMAFLRQYAQSGLMKDIPHVAGWAAYDPSILDAVGNDAIGATGSTDWAVNLDNPVNRKFVADFSEMFKRAPSHYAAASYDVAMLIDAGIKAVNGKIDDKVAFSRALHTASFKSVRGPDFKINPKNGFPIANHYAAKVVKNDQGKLQLLAGDLVVKDMKDPYEAECPAK